MDLVSSFLGAKTVKLVFLDQENTTFDCSWPDIDGACMGDIAPIALKELLDYIVTACSVPKERFEICGLEEIDLDDHREEYEDRGVRSPKLEEKIREAIREMYKAKVKASKEWDDTCLIFKSRKEYAKGDTFGELHDGEKEQILRW